MYNKIDNLKKKVPILHQCLNCEETFSIADGIACCPACFSKERTNLIIIHMEEDSERKEWLDLIDFSAGD